MIHGFLHAGLLVRDLSASLAFYQGVLGLSLRDDRPDLGYPGAWLDLGDGTQLHLMVLPNPDPTEGRPTHGGRDRHLALAVRDLEGIAKHLETAGIPYTRSRSGRAALFCRDPDGNAIELVQTGNPSAVVGSHGRACYD